MQTYVLRSILLAAICQLTVLLPSVALADSWGLPEEFDAFSENRQFVARVFPAAAKAKPYVILYSLKGDERHEKWRCQLSNTVMPTEAFVSDDGAAIVTTDNHSRVGYGDDVVAVYSQKGQLAKYSLEQFTPLPALYAGKFTHSVSSRWWRENSIEFFASANGKPCFCVWLDWDNRWVAWDLASGKLIQVSPEQDNNWKTIGRDRVLAKLKNGKASSSDHNFLGQTRVNEDRALIEAWLESTEFGSGSTTRPSKEGDRFSFTARSHKRDAAEKILARWDRVVSEQSTWQIEPVYRYLGTLKCSVTYQTTPKKNEGTLRLYLIPTGIPLNQWSRTRPAQYLVADLRYSYPRVFESLTLRDGELGKSVNFIIYGVTPGKYQLKAVWDKAPPFSEVREVLCIPNPGDYESTESPEILIQKGTATENIQFACTNLVNER